MVRIHEEYLNEAAALAARDAILRQYHPYGYGTSVTVRQDRQTRHWVLSGHRFASCD